MQENIQNKKYHIVYLGETGFPFGLGSVQRLILVSKSFISVGVAVSVIIRKGVMPESGAAQLGIQGVFEGINYLYSSPTTARPGGFLRRNWDKLKGMYGEYLFLRKLKKDNNITAAVISCMSSFHVLRYKLYSKLIGFPIILNFVELGSKMKGREKPLTRLNDLIFDHFIVKIVDGAIPISDKLAEYYLHSARNKPCIKLPILCDFQKFKLNENNDSKVTFLYCGAASYFELVDFLLKAFDELNGLTPEVVFQLILGGKAAELEKVKERIHATRNRSNVELISNVNHSDIPKYYANAKALLIPLRPSIQDEARFPHKIGEYLASGKPVITTRFGEIKNYDFIDRKTALVAEEYNFEAFAEKMNFVLEHPDISEEIGRNGREMGLRNFDYKKHGQRLKEFISLFDKNN